MMEKMSVLNNAQITWKDSGEFFDLRALVAELAVQFGRVAQKKNLFLAIDITPCTPRYFQGDPAAFTTIFANLVNNSLQSLSCRGLTVTIDAVGPNADGGYKVHIDITDSTTNAADMLTVLSEQHISADRHKKPKINKLCAEIKEIRKLAQSRGGNLYVYPTQGWGTRYLATFYYKESMTKKSIREHIGRKKSLPFIIPSGWTTPG